MKINLKDFYPFYDVDYTIEVPEEIYTLLKVLAQKEHAAFERRRTNKAFYSLDALTGIEQDIVFVVLSPQEIFERKMEIQELYAAISRLPEKQARRIYAHFFLGMSKAAIARAEGVTEKSVWESIERGLKNISKFLKEFS